MGRPRLAWAKTHAVLLAVRRGATYRDVWASPSPPKPFSQTGLIKLVRQTPKLKWFSSDLDAESVALLRDEFPRVIFGS